MSKLIEEGETNMLNTSFFTQEENKSKLKNNLENVKRVRFNDFSNYDPDKCNNGGKYGFWTDYDHLENGNWKVSYGTTADLSFCPCCNDFHSYNKESCGDYGQITEAKLLELINDFKETEECYIEYK